MFTGVFHLFVECQNLDKSPLMSYVHLALEHLTSQESSVLDVTLPCQEPQP